MESLVKQEKSEDDAIETILPDNEINHHLTYDEQETQQPTTGSLLFLHPTSHLFETSPNVADGRTSLICALFSLKNKPYALRRFTGSYSDLHLDVFFFPEEVGIADEYVVCVSSRGAVLFLLGVVPFTPWFCSPEMQPESILSLA